MNRDLLVDAISNVDEEFIIEAREKYDKRVKIVKFKKPVYLTKKFFICVAACACAIILSVCLPIALLPSNNPAVPPQLDSDIGSTPPPDINITPPLDPDPPTGSETPPTGSENPVYIEEGYTSSGNSDDITGYMLAYKLNRQFDENAEILLSFSFGLWGLKYFDNSYEFTKVAVFVANEDGQTHILEELTAEQFLNSDNKFDVEIEYTYGDLGDGHDVVTSETIIFNNEQTIAFPSSLCNKNSGFLHFVFEVYNGDEIVPNTGYFTTVYYLKLNGTINFKTYQEYLIEREQDF